MAEGGIAMRGSTSMLVLMKGTRIPLSGIIRARRSSSR
jgi:hypothetical protein